MPIPLFAAVCAASCRLLEQAQKIFHRTLQDALWICPPAAILARKHPYAGVAACAIMPAACAARHTLPEEENSLIKKFAHAAFALWVAGLSACATPPASHAPMAQPAAVSKYATIPPKKDSDLKLYRADGSIVSGPAALARMPQDAQVVLWLAGNQFFAMDEVVAAFQKQNPGLAVGLITLPPGLLLEAIAKGGWTYGGTEYPGLPDVYASVNLGHLQKLKGLGLADRYAVYMHNEMVLMVGKGNPKKIKGIDDLQRADIRTSMPNPVNEGIMQFYGRKVLERHGAWPHVSGGKECVSCQTTPNNWFTAVHHRETPDRILAGTSDTGIVWLTETIEAQRAGKAVEAVRLPPADSLRDEVAYAVCALGNGGARQANATRFLAFLATPQAQAAYGKFGFVGATAEELTLKPIP
jgi:ABC-type molybdate transport system substrate-binding protein